MSSLSPVAFCFVKVNIHLEKVIYSYDFLELLTYELHFPKVITVKISVMILEILTVKTDYLRSCECNRCLDCFAYIKDFLFVCW